MTIDRVLILGTGLLGASTGLALRAAGFGGAIAGWDKDDNQAATNFPLVRITNKASGHVFYSRTHHHSSMAVASSATVSTHFDVPRAQEKGPSTLVVIANGIPSAPVSVNVRSSDD